ncbi:cytochrome P450 [Glomus cerebriforme]|uniref:Cytochrome P450 n=1 Tax=Glomus cerebriforme TaxID=658196 RepID=A0A397TET0_9GLOM|nr:cytochrome P450 [Glomus cerebriforme]
MYQTIILGSILVATLYVLKHRHDPKLPLVPYKIPIIGHTYSYLTNCEEFLKQCRREYGDIFSLYIYGQVKTFVGKEHSHEVFAKDDNFSFGLAFNKVFPGDVLLSHLGEFKNSTKVLKDYILSKLKFYTKRMQTSLLLATQKRIGNCDEPKAFNNLYHLMTRIISTPIANLFIGEEESKYEEVITTFAEFTRDAAGFLAIPPFLDFIYPGLQNYVTRITLRLGLYNPTIKHKDILIKHIKTQVLKRLQEKEKLGDSWERPADFLQDLMDEENFDPNNVNYPLMADKMCIYIFVSVHTTSRTCANAVMDLASRPEYMQELYEEQLEVHKDADENDILPFEALDKMKKLDCFIRESLRLTGNISGLPHVVLKDYTFSNGLQVPKDHSVEIYFDDTYGDELLQGSNPKSFDPFRHMKTNPSAAKVTKNFLAFGGGKHACPGRYFAINEVKFFMHNLILKYNFRTESGKIVKKKRFGPMAFPSSEKVIFENRSK